MTIARFKDFPRPTRFRDLDDAQRWADNLWEALQQEQMERARDFDILELDNVGWEDVRAFGTDANNRQDGLANAISHIGSTKTALLITNQQDVTDNATIPATMTLRFKQGGSLNISSGKTVTINGQVEAGLYQIFQGSGTVSFGAGAVECVNIEWWGAVPNDTVDCLASFTSAYASLSSGVIELQSGTYKISAGFDHNKNDIILRGKGRYSTFIKNYTADVTLTIGKASGSLSRFEVEKLCLQGNGTATNAIHFKQCKYGAARDLFIEGHEASACVFQDVVHIDLDDNWIYGPDKTTAGIYGFEIKRVVANNTTVRSTNNYISRFYRAVHMEDYSMVGFNSLGDVYEDVYDCVYLGTSLYDINFYGVYTGVFTNKAFIVKTGRLSIINPQEMTYDDIDESGLPGADLERQDRFYMLPHWPFESYTAATDKSTHRLGQIVQHPRGIVEFGKQSRARQYKNTEQIIPTATYVRVLFDAGNYDSQDEFDISVTSGTADATEANKLHDADGGFTASIVGATIWNTTDNTYTTISGFVDSGELNLTDDIMVSGETYKIYFSTFTAIRAGYYQVVGAIRWKSAVTGPHIYIYVNGSAVASFVDSADTQTQKVSDIIYLAADDYIDIRVYQGTGASKTIDNGASKSYFSIHKLS